MSGMQDVRRYRAQQLASVHYARLQEPVACFVRRRLGGAGALLPDQELEASYNLAWAALIEQVLQGKMSDRFDGWLCVVTYRRAVDYLRRRHLDREVPLVGVDELGTVEELWELASSREIVRTVLKRIEWRFGERGARIVACLWLEGLSHAAASERVGVSTKRLRKILYGDERKVGLRDELARLLEQLGAASTSRP